MLYLTCYSCDSIQKYYWPVKIILLNISYYNYTYFFLFFVKFSLQFMADNEDSRNIFFSDGHTIGQKYEALSN